MRMQFYAVEIVRLVLPGLSISTMLMFARNREGLNDWIYEKDHPNETTTTR